MPDLLGSSIGYYHILEQIGLGAMGQVYRATDSRTGQAVAVKVIARDLSFDPDMLERFRREGEALRQLRHPNIVGFVDMFEHAGQQIIVMEYVPGGSLHELIKQGPLPIDRARRMALELCDALTRAHHLNIIHRDIKPENVLLAEDGTPKLADFGVARLMDEGLRLTGKGAQVGTPGYMSPEAWEAKPLDAQSDIWSLGVVLYEMLTGEVPFAGDTLMAVMHKVLNAPAPEVQNLRPDVPAELGNVVKRMLARDREQRYASMRQVAADLAHGVGTATVATPVTAAAPTVVSARPARRLPGWALGLAAVFPGWVLVAVGMVALILVIGLVAVLVLPGLVKPVPAATATPIATATSTATPIPTTSRIENIGNIWEFDEEGTTAGCIGTAPGSYGNGPYKSLLSLQIEQNGNTITGLGNCSDGNPIQLEGTVSGTTIQFRRYGTGCTPGYTVDWDYSGVIQGDSIAGKFSGGGDPQDSYGDGCITSGTFTIRTKGDTLR